MGVSEDERSPLVADHINSKSLPSVFMLKSTLSPASIEVIFGLTMISTCGGGSSCGTGVIVSLLHPVDRTISRKNS